MLMHRRIKSARTKVKQLFQIVNCAHAGKLVCRNIWMVLHHRQPKLTLRTAHKLDCFFHAMHNNDIGTLYIMMTSATFKSLYGNATKRLKLLVDNLTQARI